MKDMRILGSMIHKLALEKHVPNEELGLKLGFSEDQVCSLYKGRMYPTFVHLETLAECFGVTVDDVLAGDEAYYEKNVVHNMGEFEKPENREIILDIIDDYLRLREAVEL